MAFHGASCAVRFVAAVKNCFARVPKSWSLSTDKITILEITSSATTIFVTPSGYVSSSSDSSVVVVELNGLFAEKQGLSDGQMVFVRPVKNAVPQCQCVEMDPLCSDEWEILEQHAKFIENNLLNQVRVIWTGAVLPFWVTDRMCTFVKIGAITPNTGECSLLQSSTEVRVCPKVRDRGQSRLPGKERLATTPTTSASMGDARLGVAGFERLLPVTERQSPLMEQGGPQRSQRSSMLRSSLDSAMAVASSATSAASQSSGNSGNVSGLAPPSLWSILVSGVLLGTSKKRKSPVSPENSRSLLDRSNSVMLDDHFLNVDLDLTLRVQLDDDGISLSPGDFGDSGTRQQQQESTWRDAGLTSVCYLSIESVSSAATVVGSGTVDLGRIKPFFLASVSKLNSPGELDEIYRSNRKRLREDVSTSSISSVSGGGGGSGTASNRGTLDRQRRQTVAGNLVGSGGSGSLRPYEDAEKEVLLGVVRVVIVELAAVCPRPDTTSGWPPCAIGHVTFSRDFCGLHDLCATSRVRLVALQSSHFPASLERFELHATSPVSYLANVDELKIALGHYLDVVRSNGLPIVLNSHDRLRFPIARDAVGEFVVKAKPSCPVAGKPESDRDGQQHQPVYFCLDRTCAEMAVFNLEPIAKWDVNSCEPASIPKLGIESLGGFRRVFEECEVYLRHGFTVSPASTGLLICGPKGCGKTSLAHALMRQLYGYPCLCYSVEVDCKKLLGKRLDSLQQQLSSLFGEAIWRQPSVVLLDDVHAVARAAMGPEEEISGEVIYCSRVTEVIRDLLKKLTAEGHRVSVIATCLSKGAIQQRLFSTSGMHFFQKTVEIQQPDRDQRVAMLRSLLVVKGAGWSGRSADVSSSLDLEEVARLTDGFYPADLAAVVDRALLALQMKHRKDRDELSTEDFKEALLGFTPQCLRDVPLHIASDVTWKDVGGLAAVKRTLIQMLEWPKKYPLLYAQCPIRLQSGVLLFGPPGTGKTLLASAVARESGLNFISIKGPELLSKYIGASEQAVRTTFARAQSAKPCILFFDEFDSFAPMRGHDSTGVTDRVVNQLLTHLDGLEALTGVYVLAASSRPDLIDPALLRPGRLDKCIYCPIPDEADRCEILHALSRKLQLADDVDMADIAKQCEFFTGADLKSLLGNAQLAAAHEFLAKQKRKRPPSLHAGKKQASFNCSFDEQTSTDDPVDGIYAMSVDDDWQDLSTLEDKRMMSELNAYMRWMSSRHRERSQVAREPLSVVVTQAHLIEAATKTQPSVSAADRRHYELVYRNFLTSKESQFVSLRPEQAKQKITLA